MISRLDEKITQEIIAVLERFTDAWNKKDMAAFMACFAEAAEFTDVVGQIALGKAAIEKQHVFPFQVVMREAVLQLEDLYMREIKPDLVMVSGKWKVTGSLTPDGKALPPRTGVIQFMIEKTKGWQILLVHNADHALPFEKRGGFIS